MKKIHELVKKYPNDMELGKRVREEVLKMQEIKNNYRDWKTTWESK